MRVRILSEGDARRLTTAKAAIDECRAAFARLGRGEVELPGVLTIEVKERHGEVHAKGGFIHGSPYFAIKVATGFYDNAAIGLPTTSGAVWVFSAMTGQLVAIILDNGYLTELRTGAAGAVAADVLARSSVETVGVVGAGAQARYQLESLLVVRSPAHILVWNHNRARAVDYAAEMSARLGRVISVADSLQQLAERSDLIVTSTPSSEPLLRSSWIRPGTHITAMGSDMPHKQELEPALLARATVIPDRLSQCLTQGEIHHAVAAGVMSAADVRAELGEIVAGLKPGRISHAEITIADQTGVGVLDAAMASAVVARAEVEGVGQVLEI